jgi:diguanylate cyclase (GGDEF)-like protein
MASVEPLPMAPANRAPEAQMLSVSLPPVATAPLDPHAQLLRMLMPRVRHLAMFGPGGSQLWTGDAMDPPEMRDAAIEVMSTQGGGKRVAFGIDGSTRNVEDATLYIFCLRDEAAVPLASVVLFVPVTGEVRPFSLVLGLVRPALEVLQRELLLRAALAAAPVQPAAPTAPMAELDALLDLAALEGQADDLASLVEAAQRQVQARVGVLVVPDKGLALVRAARAATDLVATPEATQEATRLLASMHRHLLNYAQLQQRPLLGTAGRDDADQGPRHRVLSVPVRRRGQRVVGFLAFFAAPDAPPFTGRALRVVEWVARRVGELLDQRYDAATGLPTRAEFERQVHAACNLPGTHHLLYLGIDGLQLVNEQFGLHVGDEVLLRVAEVARRRTPRGAICARLDGDRMVICLPGHDADQALAVADGLCMAVAELTHARGDGTVRVSASVGVADYVMPEGSQSGWHEGLSRALALAEAACRQAKAAGGCCTQLWEEPASGQVPVALASIIPEADAPILARLRQALDAEMPALLVQPLLPLQGYGEPRFELLLRLGEGSDALTPDKLLPVAERAGLLPALDRWVVRHAIDLLSSQVDLLSRRIARFTINLSYASLCTPAAAAALLDVLEERLAVTRLPADLLCFDISAAHLAPGMPGWNAALPALQRLRMLGCGIALDDFVSPTGIAGPVIVDPRQPLPLTEVKLDGRRVRAMLDDATADGEVRAALQWAAQRGLDTVAKCVETEALRLRMQDLGCAYGQGFAMGRPLPLAGVLEDLSMYELLAAAPGATLDD